MSATTTLPDYIRDPRFTGPSPAEALVFIHGIFSNHHTFDLVREQLSKASQFANCSLDAYDYDFTQRIADSGLQLADGLLNLFGSNSTKVTLVGHSMGGLVGRLALLQRGHKLPFVKRLIMLGTPNHGTLHTARLGIMVWALRGTTSCIWSICSRKTGLKDLTEIGKVMAEFVTPESVARTEHVEYVTVPAMFFNEDTGIFTKGKGTSAGLKTLDFAMRLAQAFPLARIGLRVPHDGIVEETSVFLGSEPRSRFSERDARCPALPYVHILHQDYKEADHVTVQSIRRTVEILKSLLPSKTIKDWCRSQPKYEFGFKPEV